MCRPWAARQVTYCKWKACDVRKAKEELESSFSNLSVTLPTSQLILQSFRRFIYVTAHSPTLPLFLLRHSSFFNPYFAFPTSQALHLRHLANRPWYRLSFLNSYLEQMSKIVSMHRVKKTRNRPETFTAKFLLELLCLFYLALSICKLSIISFESPYT